MDDSTWFLSLKQPKWLDLPKLKLPSTGVTLDSGVTLDNFQHPCIVSVQRISQWGNHVIKNFTIILIFISNFEKICGIQDDKFLTFRFLILKYYIYVCKTNKNPHFIGLTLLLNQSEKLSTILQPRKINSKVTLKSGGLICNWQWSFFKIYFHNMFSPFMYICMRSCLSCIVEYPCWYYKYSVILLYLLFAAFCNSLELFLICLIKQKHLKKLKKRTSQ